MERRKEFCNLITEMFDNNELSEKAIIFSDEAHFYLNGYVNKQNYRFWGRENPNVIKATPLHPIKVTVWAAISIKGVYLHVFDSTITGTVYSNMLSTKFFPHAKKRGLVNGYYFMQDGAAPHRAHEVFETINKVYGDRVIGLGYSHFIRGEGIEWPPYSPDLSPCDFFLWGYLKDLCYEKNPQTKEDLVKQIRQTASGISKEQLERVFDSFKKRLEYCANAEGAHFENIYH